MKVRDLDPLLFGQIEGTDLADGAAADIANLKRDVVHMRMPRDSLDSGGGAEDLAREHAVGPCVEAEVVNLHT